MKLVCVRPVYIYILGIVPLAFFYDYLKGLVESEFVFVLLVIVYLLVVRFVAQRLCGYISNMRSR